jgi:polysaccharide pyruvyl transferase WcaK-like protein
MPTQGISSAAGARAESARPQQIGLFGCPLDTGNSGVSALGLSTILGISEALPQAEVTVFDYGPGIRQKQLQIGERGIELRFARCAYSRRFYQPSNLQQMRVAARLGLRRLQPMLRLLDGLDLILDISAGDSFSDLYGDWRFQSVSAPKLLALDLGIPLVLLPQTYGPFEGTAAKELAARILSNANSVWARDARSLEVARSTARPDTDPQRFHLGVDVAFGLPARQPDDPGLIDAIEAFRSRFATIVGLNVSGLLYNEPGEDQRRYGMRAPYRDIIGGIMDRLVSLDGVGILLVPHVTTPGQETRDCDATASSRIRSTLPPAQRERFLFAPDSLGAMQAKWVISHTDWFCGTRMHACIAAISQGIPTAAIAYSDKTRGVFESAGVGESVVDPRKIEGTEVVDRVLENFRERASVSESLAASLPRVRSQLQQQFEAMTANPG